MKWRKYGLDIEMTGLTQKQVISMLSKKFNYDYGYDSEENCYNVADPLGRVWRSKFAPDVEPEKKIRR